MEDKIEVGEYVRTEEGYIGILIEYIPNALNYLKIDIGREIRRDNGRSDNYIYTRYGFQLKHSKQLIDLIEVGDIVEIRTGLHSSFKYFVENEDNLLLLEEKVKEFWNIEIILTKEQYIANCYKVGGEDEC